MFCFLNFLTSAIPKAGKPGGEMLRASQLFPPHSKLGHQNQTGLPAPWLGPTAARRKKCRDNSLGTQPPQPTAQRAQHSAGWWSRKTMDEAVNLALFIISNLTWPQKNSLFYSQNIPFCNKWPHPVAQTPKLAVSLDSFFHMYAQHTLPIFC